MDSSAIKAIRDLALSEQINERLSALSYLSSPVVALPDQYKITDLEKHSIAPSRFRGEFKTHVIDAFIDYVNSNADNHTGLFIDPENAMARGIINMGDANTPAWGDHKAVLTLKKTPEFAALLALNGRTISQQDLIDFAEDWYMNAEFIDDSGDKIVFRFAINAIRKLSVSSTQNNEQMAGNFNASHSSLDAIEVKAAGSLPPHGFNFVCPPYESFSPRTFSCQLRAMTDGKTVGLKFRIIALDNIINEIGDEFKELLQENIDTADLKSYIGEMKYQ